MNDRVTTHIEGGVATVMLNRADRKNAVDMDMFAALADAARSLADDPGVRAVVLTGDGADFCAGIDISLFSGDGFGAQLGRLMAPGRQSGANFFQAAALCWAELPVPVIAALRGVVFGAGFQIAMGADLRLAAADARLSIMEIRWGLIPDMAITVTLPGTVPLDRVRELAYTGRIVAADEAESIGLVTGVVDDPLHAARALAADIAARSPDAIRAIKSLTRAAWRPDQAALLGLEAELQARVMAGANQKEAAAANAEKRSPVFRDPD